MKKLLSMISKLPVYSEMEWISILKLKMNFSLYKSEQTRNSLLLDQALIAETRERRIYHSLMIAAETAQESIYSYGQLIASMVEIAKPLKNNILTGEDYPPIFELLLPDNMGKLERDDLRLRIQSLSDFGYALERVLNDDRSENISADIKKQIYFSCASEAGQYLASLFNALQTSKEDMPDASKLGSKIIVVDQLKEKEANVKYVPLTNDAFNEKLEKESQVKRQLDLTITARNAVGICNQINVELNKYKSTLHDYITSELKRIDVSLYIEYFNTYSRQDPIIVMSMDASADIFLQKAPSRAVVPMNIDEPEIKVKIGFENVGSTEIKTNIECKTPAVMQTPLAIITSEASKNKLNKYLRSNPNLARAMQNYQLADGAQKYLNQVPADGILPIATARLSHFQSSYGQIGSKLQLIGDQTVDSAAYGLLNFFRRIWAKISWRYSKNHTAEVNFIKQTNYLSGLARTLNERARRQGAASISEEMIRPANTTVKP